MKPWEERPVEERALLNPGVCSVLLWSAANSYRKASGLPMRLDLTFIVLPVVLDRVTRDALPATARTSLPVWLRNHPLLPSRVAQRSRTLVPFAKEALLFGGAHGLLEFGEEGIVGSQTWKRRVAVALRESSDEVRLCAKRAEFLGRWFSNAGSADTVMALLGVRP